MKALSHIIYFLAWRVGLYRWWSRLYRSFNHAKYSAVPVDHGLAPDFVLSQLNMLHWTADGPRELWDAVGSPHWVQHCINVRMAGNPQPKGALDCDEFAEWAALAMSSRYLPYVLNVAWKEKDGWAGHHVCVYLYRGGEYCHIGNWGKLGPFPSETALIKDMLRKVKAEYLVGWAVFEPRRLKLVRWGLKLKE